MRAADSLERCLVRLAIAVGVALLFVYAVLAVQTLTGGSL